MRSLLRIFEIALIFNSRVPLILWRSCTFTIFLNDVLPSIVHRRSSGGLSAKYSTLLDILACKCLERFSPYHKIILEQVHIRRCDEVLARSGI